MDTLPSRSARRLGGVAGLVAALALAPAYIVGTPDTPTTPEEAAAYYETAELFLTFNGVVPLLHSLSFLVFLGVLVALLRAAPRAPQWAAFAAIGGGIMYVALCAAGFVAEITYPATVSRFPEAADASEWPLFMLIMSVWLYHFCQIGTAVLMIGTAVVAFKTDVLPSWYAWITVAFAVVAILHVLGSVVPSFGLFSGVAGVAWLALTSGVLFVAGRGADTGEPARA